METNITTNRKARFEYDILDTLEAGIQLKGSEVKSCRNHKANLEGSFVTIKNGEVFLLGMHIDEYKCSGTAQNSHEPRRVRKLLLHKSEILKFAEKSLQKGHTIVPLRAYFNDKGIAKIEIAVVSGKKKHDKRRAEKEKQEKRELGRFKR